MFENRVDYTIALLKLLEMVPENSGRSSQIQQLFFEIYQNEISAEDRQKLTSGGYRWAKEVQWSRYECVKKGLMDAPSIGIWRLTDKGKLWIQTQKDMENIGPIEMPLRTRKKKKIIQKKNNRAKANEILEREITTIQSYLAGHGMSQVNSEKLCDWIQFSYIFEMYNEATELFSYIDANEVHPWYFERTKRIFKVCEQKANFNEEG